MVDRKKPLELQNNAFGKLVRSFREQRGWSQGDLAEQWGYTREYVSLIELGKRKLDKLEQIERLADILGISQEQLRIVGKGLPSRKSQSGSLEDNDPVLLQTLLEPAQTTVKLSYLLWRADGPIDIASSLQSLQGQLDQALISYGGQFRIPALRILSSLHEMLGKLAIERTATREAMSHFQEMYDLAEEVNDPDIVMLALIHQSEMFRRDNKYEAAFRRMKAAENYAKKHKVSEYIQGIMWKASAINCFVHGDEEGFLRAIDRAEALAENITETVDTLIGEFDRVDVLQVRAIGLTTLWKPEKSIPIYKDTDKLRPFRTPRDQSSYQIIKAQSAGWGIQK
ncbi:MAG TPA: helix-turn-helix transcriptional regulator [Ktedonosporobacter sp.]|nr:helix-turn-helix transcriptional regulator [Ktedonosporobacter sp.]